MTDDAKPYYVFARCSQTGGVGDWLVTTEQKSYKDATYFYFEFGSIEVPSVDPLIAIPAFDTQVG